MHVGNLRTALYTYLIARHAHGKFMLRIEDTDQGRLVEGAVDVIYKTMRECRLEHDEGPDVGGPCRPLYVQTERRGHLSRNTPTFSSRRDMPTTASARRRKPKRIPAISLARTTLPR